MNKWFCWIHRQYFCLWKKLTRREPGLALTTVQVTGTQFDQYWNKRARISFWLKCKLSESQGGALRRQRECSHPKPCTSSTPALIPLSHLIFRKTDWERSAQILSKGQFSLSLMAFLILFLHQLCQSRQVIATRASPTFLCTYQCLAKY